MLMEVTDKLFGNSKPLKTNKTNLFKQSDEERIYIEVFRLIRLLKE